MGTLSRGLLICAGLLTALLEATALVCSVLLLLLLVLLLILGLSGSEGAEAALDAGGGVLVLSRGRTTCAPELSLGSVCWVVLRGAVLLGAICLGAASCSDDVA